MGQAKLLDGTLLDEHSGYRFLLISRDECTDLPENQKQVIAVSSAKHPELREMLDAMQLHSILLRPDRYILLTMRSAQEARSAVSNLHKALAVLN